MTDSARRHPAGNASPWGGHGAVAAGRPHGLLRGSSPIPGRLEVPTSSATGQRTHRETMTGNRRGDAPWETRAARKTSKRARSRRRKNKAKERKRSGTSKRRAPRNQERSVRATRRRFRVQCDPRHLTARRRATPPVPCGRGHRARRTNDARNRRWTDKRELASPQELGCRLYRNRTSGRAP
jgi:hypothetical protein